VFSASVVSLTCPSTQPECQPGGDRVLVGTQAGNEGFQRELADGVGAGHPLLAAATSGHDRSEGPDVPGDSDSSEEAARVASRLTWTAGSRPSGLVMIQDATEREQAWPRKRAR
jgi:hypothetical protein